MIKLKTRRILGTAIYAFTAAAVAAPLLAVVRAESAYRLDELRFYDSPRSLDQDAGRPKDYKSACPAGAPLDAPFYRPDLFTPCVIWSPFKTETPRIKLEIVVSYDRIRPWTTQVPVTCTMTGAGGQSVSQTRFTGAVPNLLALKAGTASWLGAFERPLRGWAAGRYQVTCQASGETIRAWLDIK